MGQVAAGWGLALWPPAQLFSLKPHPRGALHALLSLLASAPLSPLPGNLPYYLTT